MDRAPDFESVGSEFESRRGRLDMPVAYRHIVYMGVFWCNCQLVIGFGAIPVQLMMLFITPRIYCTEVKKANKKVLHGAWRTFLSYYDHF
jgi:hypothetical protein